MTLEDALHALGVRDNNLTDAEKRSLDEQGFLHLAGVLTRAQAERMLAEVHRLFALERTGEEGARGECEQIQNKSDAFDICLTHPRLLAAVCHVLRGDLVSQGVHSRPNPPGKGRQGLHQDGPSVPPGEYVTCNSIWPLDDFTAENGATRVVPGSHRWGKAPGDEMADPLAPHPREVYLVAPVGTVVIFNGHLWHSSTLNRSTADRPNVTSFWARRGQTHFDATPAPELTARLSPAARRLLPDAAAPAPQEPSHAAPSLP